MPLQLKDFSEATQNAFCDFIGKDNSIEIDLLLAKQSFRAALYWMLYSRKQDSDRSEEEMKLIYKDFEIIDCCYDSPIERFQDDHNTEFIEFFEDYTVLVSDKLWRYPPAFYENYYSYIYNNVKHLHYVMYCEEKLEGNKLEKFGVYFEDDGENLTVLYTEKFKDGLFTPGYFKPKAP